MDNYQINDQINDMDLEILKMINANPGIKVSELQKRLSINNFQVSENQIRNSIKRKIYDLIEYKGSKKTGGYYIKNG
ncbi:hypothetical protein A9CBEGH2_13910 [Amedibacterium intestinale]|uniref:Uncharacterized protein n=2 Tax=Amedibacterium intestinale TaxID=2583452 RepID=A0A6N4THB2_9FIRM|nr:hypothetical protein Aargi30884_12930 [Amedibacterium intestinale]BBK62451.1 hypothetical protein A9CBEGH2_13910 [Amedibacterium intestinale]